MPTKRKVRKAISKSLRFEVFKRDSFKCHYCGAEAPNVLLHIDHIKPVAGGGTNDITNLITACAACNSGKRDVPLDDHTAVSKSRRQMEELQQRREQLDLVMQWREGLRDLKGETADRLAGYWNNLAPGWVVSDAGKRTIEKWLRNCSVSEITDAMDTAADTYLDFTNDGTVTEKTWELAFGKILGICRVRQDSEEDPDLRQLLYTRGIVRNRLDGYYYDNVKALQLLMDARNSGVPVDRLDKIARAVRNWTEFRNEIEEEILSAATQSTR